jgi:hypothetical protein
VLVRGTVYTEARAPGQEEFCRFFFGERQFWSRLGQLPIASIRMRLISVSYVEIAARPPGLVISCPFEESGVVRDVKKLVFLAL